MDCGSDRKGKTLVSKTCPSYNAYFKNQIFTPGVIHPMEKVQKGKVFHLTNLVSHRKTQLPSAIICGWKSKCDVKDCWLFKHPDVNTNGKLPFATSEIGRRYRKKGLRSLIPKKCFGKGDILRNLTEEELKKLPKLLAETRNLKKVNVLNV